MFTNDTPLPQINIPIKCILSLLLQPLLLFTNISCVQYISVPLLVACLPPDVSISKRGLPVHQSFQYSATNIPWRYCQIFTSEILFKMSTSSLIHYIQCTGSFVNKNFHILPRELGTTCELTAQIFTYATYFLLHFVE